MNCAEFEILLADYIDNTLDAARKHELEQHRDSCAACGELARDAVAAISFIERSAEVAVPQELLTKITFEIPTGRQRPGQKESVFTSLRRFFQPLMQPKFAMGMAMTILSFSLLGKFSGFEVSQLKPADLAPAAVWAATEDRVHKSWERVLKYYEGLKVVYEVQSRLKEWTEQEEERPQQTAPAKPGAPKPTGNANQGKGKR